MKSSSYAIICIVAFIVLLLHSHNVNGSSVNNNKNVDRNSNKLLENSASRYLRGLYDSFLDSKEEVAVRDDDGDDDQGDDEGDDSQDGDGGDDEEDEEGDENSEDSDQDDDEEQDAEGPNEQDLDNAEEKLENADEDVRKEEKEASVEKKAKLAKKEMKKGKEKVEAEKTAKIKDQIAAKKAAEKVPNKKKKKRDAWGAYIDSLEPTGVASKCTTTCRKSRKRKAQVCETLCEPILPVGTKANAEL